ncbi:MAG: tyrosine-protein phosphatase [Elusimicrobia bacterium]|nr:tyrosine-protein phosphatase [Elusimicrobiota bacterium]
MKAKNSPLSLALLAVLCPPAVPQGVDSPQTRSAVLSLVQQARTVAPDLDDEEPGEVTDEEASRPPTPVSEGIYRSSRPNIAALDHLYDLGVRTILNLENKKHHEEEERALRALESRRAAEGKPSWRIASVSVPMSGLHPPSFSELDKSLTALADGTRRPILVHCKHGEDRTGVVVSAYRVEVEKKKTVPEAVKEAKSFRCCHLVLVGEDSLFRYLWLYHWRRW